MKNLKLSVKTKTSWLLLAIFSFVFVSLNACKKDPAEPGKTYAKFHVIGKAVNPSNEPVSGIKVTIKDAESAPVTTKEDGAFSLQGKIFNPTEKFSVVIEDTNNPALYVNETIEVTLEKSDYTEEGDGKLYKGSFKKEVNINLKAISEPQ